MALNWADRAGCVDHQRAAAVNVENDGWRRHTGSRGVPARPVLAPAADRALDALDEAFIHPASGAA